MNWGKFRFMYGVTGAPQTPAAQPYGTYRPTYREQTIAELVDCYSRPIFITSDTECSVLRSGSGSKEIH